MFSKEPHHYRPTPRTLQSSKFGAYSKLTPVGRRNHERLWAAAGVIALGVFYGLLYFKGWL